MPFDGWDIPAYRLAVAEGYPSLWHRGFANDAPWLGMEPLEIVAAEANFS
jgi:hypothetical protein